MPDPSSSNAYSSEEGVVAGHSGQFTPGGYLSTVSTGNFSDVSAVICNFWHPGTLTLSPERQSARMSKITNDRLNPVWHRMLYSCTHMAIVGVKGLR